MQILIYTRLCQVTTLMGASLTSKELNEFMKEADKVISIQIKSTIRGGGGGGFTIAQTLRDKRQIVTEISGGHLCTCLQLSQIFQSRQTGTTEI